MVIQSIDTIEQLVHNQNLGPGYDGYRNLVDAIHIKPEELMQHLDPQAEQHQRLCLYDTPEIEAIVTYWRPGQHSRIHDYNFQQAWTKVIKGQLILEFFDVFEGEPKAEITETRLLDQDEVIYMNNSFGYHRYSNLSEGDTIAIHLYADKIDQWHIYEPESGVISVEPTRYDKSLEPHLLYSICDISYCVADDRHLSLCNTIKQRNMFGLFSSTKSYDNLDASAFAEAMKKSDTVVLDVRTRAEYNSGHIPGAKHIDVSSRDFYSKAQSLDPNKHYLVYCRSGMRSADACRQLSKMKFEKLSNLRGGIMQWRGKLK